MQTYLAPPPPPSVDLSQVRRAWEATRETPENVYEFLSKAVEKQHEKQAEAITACLYTPIAKAENDNLYVLERKMKHSDWKKRHREAVIMRRLYKDHLDRLHLQQYLSSKESSEQKTAMREGGFQRGHVRFGSGQPTY